MKHIPILFSTPMVQAILEGTKTQTRRVLKPQPIDNTEIDGNFFDGKSRGYVKVDSHPNWREQFVFEFSKYQPGDVLWVRETFRRVMDMETNEQWIEYAADNPEPIYECDGDGFKLFNRDGTPKMLPFKPSIHMPKTACRIFLKIKTVRCERLQDINEDDACREGIELIDHNCFRNYDESNPYQFLEDPIGSFKSLWQSINGGESWDANPWVWVIEFERCEMPKCFLDEKE